MLSWRISLGTLFVAVLIGLCWWDHHAAIPGIVLFPLAIALTILAGEEFLQLAAAGRLKPLRWAVHGANLLVVLSSWVPPACLETSGGRAVSNDAFAGGVFPLDTIRATDQWLVLAVAAGLFLFFLGEMRRYEKPGRVLVNLATATLAMLYAGLLVAMLVRLRLGFGVGALASLVIVVKMCDTGAYTVGRLIGRHKMAPVLSPGKTIEGAIGGLVFACLGSVAAFAWLVPAITGGAAAGSWWSWLAFGLIVGLAGMLGDLAESLIKRDVGQKDSSRWMPGFGGVLDILDSVLLATPAAYACWALGLVGR